MKEKIFRGYLAELSSRMQAKANVCFIFVFKRVVILLIIVWEVILSTKQSLQSDAFTCNARTIGTLCLLYNFNPILLGGGGQNMPPPVFPPPSQNGSKYQAETFRL